jgi:hypothetical protein
MVIMATNAVASSNPTELKTEYTFCSRCIGLWHDLKKIFSSLLSAIKINASYHPATNNTPHEIVAVVSVETAETEESAKITAAASDILTFTSDKKPDFNTSLVHHLDELLEGQLGLHQPEQKSDATNYREYLRKQEDTDLLEQLPISESQKFVFLNLILRNAGCLAENIDFHPDTKIPTTNNFKDILNPNQPIKAAYLRFPCLDLPVDEEIKRFYVELDVDQIIEKLMERLKSEYPEEFQDPETEKNILEKIYMLKARLLMIKHGLDWGYTQRELIALDLPPTGNTKIYANMVASNPIPETYQWCFQHYAGKHVRKSPFNQAWKNSYDPSKANPLNSRKFVGLILDALEGLNRPRIYGLEEEYVYRMGGHDDS